MLLTGKCCNFDFLKEKMDEHDKSNVCVCFLTWQWTWNIGQLNISTRFFALKTHLVFSLSTWKWMFTHHKCSLAIYSTICTVNGTNRRVNSGNLYSRDSLKDGFHFTHDTTHRLDIKCMYEMLHRCGWKSKLLLANGNCRFNLSFTWNKTNRGTRDLGYFSIW